MLVRSIYYLLHIINFLVWVLNFSIWMKILLLSFVEVSTTYYILSIFSFECWISVIEMKELLLIVWSCSLKKQNMIFWVTWPWSACTCLDETNMYFNPSPNEIVTVWDTSFTEEAFKELETKHTKNTFQMQNLRNPKSTIQKLCHDQINLKETQGLGCQYKCSKPNNNFCKAIWSCCLKNQSTISSDSLPLSFCDCEVLFFISKEAFSFKILIQNSSIFMHMLSHGLQKHLMLHQTHSGFFAKNHMQKWFPSCKFASNKNVWSFSYNLG